MIDDNTENACQSGKSGCFRLYPFCVYGKYSHFVIAPALFFNFIINDNKRQKLHSIPEITAQTAVVI